ncbi:V-type ATPase subunit [bacterium]|nr:V-type ATPase subunit [bacterium]
MFIDKASYVEYNPEYLFAVGKLRVYERKLINKATLTQLIECNGFGELVSILSERNYSDNISSVEKPEDLENLIFDEMSNTIGEIKKLSHDDEVTNLYLFRYDMQNLKLLIKAGKNSEDVNHALLYRSVIDTENLEDSIKEEIFSVFPESLRDKIRTIWLEEVQQGNLQDAEILLDKLWLETGFCYMKDSGQIFLRDLFSVLIDIYNIKVILRTKVMGYDSERVRKYIAEGGFIDKSVMSNSYNMELEGIVKSFQFSDYNKIIKPGVEYFERYNSFWKFEQLCNDFLVEFVDIVKFLVASVSALIRYLIIKEIELKNLRAILIGKNNGLSSEQISQNLGCAYA